MIRGLKGRISNNTNTPLKALVTVVRLQAPGGGHTFMAERALAAYPPATSFQETAYDDMVFK